MNVGRPTIAFIDLKALDHNLGEVRAKAGGRKVLAVVKADAYGHGAVEVARRLESRGVEMFGVAMVEEGARLREAGIMTPILVLGGVFDRQAPDLIGLDLTPTLFSSAQVDAFSEAAVKAGRTLPVHFKVDTGMGRLGMSPEEAVAFIKSASHMPGLSCEGIMTHLAEVGGEDKSFAEYQVGRFRWVLQKLEDEGITFPLVHAAGSAAVIDYSPALFNMVRPGIMLYGSYPDEWMRSVLELRPVMSVKTKIVHLKAVEKGRPISYGRTFHTHRPSIIATLPIGYADGLDRGLSNKGSVLIGGKRCPVVGRVCMDLTMVDVTDVDEVHVGSDAVVIGRQGTDEITSEEVAALLGTISYEVLCGISARVPRVYIY